MLCCTLPDGWSRIEACLKNLQSFHKFKLPFRKKLKPGGLNRTWSDSVLPRYHIGSASMPAHGEDKRMSFQWKKLASFFCWKQLIPSEPSHKLVIWLVERLYHASIDDILFSGSWIKIRKRTALSKEWYALFEIGISDLRALRVVPCVPRPHSHRSNWSTAFKLSKRMGRPLWTDLWLLTVVVLARHPHH